MSDTYAKAQREPEEFTMDTIHFVDHRCSGCGLPIRIPVAREADLWDIRRQEREEGYKDAITVFRNRSERLADFDETGSDEARQAADFLIRHNPHTPPKP